MTQEQQASITNIYGKFILADEVAVWDEIDDSMEKLDWLSDQEMVQEARFQAVKHLIGKIGCSNPNCKKCFMPEIVNAVSYILEDYLITRVLDFKNRYVLAYYLSMSHLGLITSEEIK